MKNTGIYAFGLSKFEGKALLIVNTASECGYTPQYKGLEALYQKYKDRGLVVLGFPSNEFGAQEPGTDAQIAQFCELKFGVTFPLFPKGMVKGPNKQPLFRSLTEGTPGKEGEIAWNFEKFLIDRSGNLVERYKSGVAPESPELAAAVERVLSSS